MMLVMLVMLMMGCCAGYHHHLHHHHHRRPHCSTSSTSGTCNSRSSSTSSRHGSIERHGLSVMLRKIIISGSSSSSLKAKVVDDDEKEMLALDVFNILLDKFGGDIASIIGNNNDEDDDSHDDDDEVNDRSKLFDGVIRVYCTHSQPSFSMPWQRQKQEFSTSTGFVIDGGRILTNAHAVEYGSLIQVKKRQSEKKYVASVIAVGHECDLAMLSVDDPTFWDGLEPLNFGNIPELLEDVSVIGFPVGGDSLSITSGVVSRIEMQEYAQASAELLAIQIDAAINPGQTSSASSSSLS